MRRFQHLDLRGMLPFVLVGIFPAEQIISHCQWEGNELRFLRIGWDVRHWFSSGVSDEMARKSRGSTCYEAWRRRDAGSAEWLRGLHASHSPVRGSFSICVHRPDAVTVSYTEAAFTGGILPCATTPDTHVRPWDVLTQKSISRPRHNCCCQLKTFLINSGN